MRVREENGSQNSGMPTCHGVGKQQSQWLIAKSLGRLDAASKPLGTSWSWGRKIARKQLLERRQQLDSNWHCGVTCSLFAMRRLTKTRGLTPWRKQTLTIKKKRFYYNILQHIATYLLRWSPWGVNGGGKSLGVLIYIPWRWWRWWSYMRYHAIVCDIERLWMATIRYTKDHWEILKVNAWCTLHMTSIYIHVSNSTKMHIHALNITKLYSPYLTITIHYSTNLNV